MRKRNYHSRSYHKFFEDWAEKKVYDKNGKMHVERVYVGKYYRSPLSAKHRIIQRVIYVLLYIFSVIFFILGGVKDIPANLSLVPSIFVAVCIFPLARLLLPLLSNLTIPKEMIIRQYRASSLDLIRVSGIAAGALVVTALVNLLFLLVNNSSAREAALCALCYLVAAVFLFVLNRLEQHLEYEVLPPRANRPEQSTVIKFESATQRF